jgi:hypothetical protein
MNSIKMAKTMGIILLLFAPYLYVFSSFGLKAVYSRYNHITKQKKENKNEAQKYDKEDRTCEAEFCTKKATVAVPYRSMTGGSGTVYHYYCAEHAENPPHTRPAVEASGIIKLMLFLILISIIVLFVIFISVTPIVVPIWMLTFKKFVRKDFQIACLLYVSSIVSPWIVLLFF